MDPDQRLRDLLWCGWVGLEKTPLSTSGNRGGLTAISSGWRLFPARLFLCVGIAYRLAPFLFGNRVVLLSILVLLFVFGRMVFLSILVFLLVSGDTVSADISLRSRARFSISLYGRMLSLYPYRLAGVFFLAVSLSCTVTWLVVRLLQIFAFPFVSTGASFPGPSGLGLCWFLCAFPACRN